MLSILFNWLYIGIVTFLLGIGFSVFSTKIFGYGIKRVDSVLVAGITISTVYAQVFSLFAGVQLAANVVLIVTCVIICATCHGFILEFLKNTWKSCGVSKKFFLLVLVVLWSYFTSRGYMHIDSDLYHAQSIRWIEEYGVVPGLGNLHERFAYNSSFFALSALYSMKFLIGESLHTVSGFFALILSITALDITKSWKRRKFILPDYARVAAIYYLTTIIDEVISPASDYSIMCMIFFIVIKWLDCLEKDKEQSEVMAPYALLCVVGVYALTLKLTAGLILILVIKPAFELIRQKKWKEILVYLSLGLAVAAPWFARTIMISGWLIYPFPALDLFQVDWKMNADLIAVDAAQISAWGKALYDIALLDTPVTEWLPNWFLTTLSGTEKLLVLGSFGCIIIYAMNMVWICIKKQWEKLDFALVVCAVICSYLFWQISAPLMRYGYAYVLLSVFLTAGGVLTGIGKGKFIYGLIILYGIYKVAIIGEHIYNSRLVDTYIHQGDYGIYEMVTYEVDGIVFYKPAYGALQGYDYFPASPTEASIELRGDGLEDGFRHK